MAFNPSPKVAAARAYAKKFNKKIVIIFSFDDDNLEMVTYGKTKELCEQANIKGTYLYDLYMTELY